MAPSAAGSSVFPSASTLAPALLELGPLRNGIGSIRNLELLLKSIKVGQKQLFAAVAAVHADCASMISSLQSLRDALVSRGTDEGCARHLTDALHASLTSLETALAHTVRVGRLSAARRLALEHDLARLGRNLGAILPLVALVDRAARPLAELTPVEWVHATSAEESSEAVPGWFGLAEDLAGTGLPIDLDVAKMLIVLGVGLVVQGAAAPQVSLEFGAPGGVPRTTIVRSAGESAGTPVRIAQLPLVEPSLASAETACRRLGGKFEYAPGAHRVCIFWPLS